jgi:site-specific recombinase XerD
MVSKMMTSVGDITTMVESFTRHLKARNRSPRTIQSYQDSVGNLSTFLAHRGKPADVASITREHVEAWISSLLEHHRPPTAAIRYR